LVIIGKTNTPEMGLVGLTEPLAFGSTPNPWHLDYSPCGSSGGSAVAVASRMVPMAHASDGGGSIRLPASACGIFGLKPTRARTPLGPQVGEHWYGFTVEHAVTRSVRDSAALLDVTHGMDAGAPYGAPQYTGRFLDEVSTPPDKLTIAYTPKPLFGTHSHPECDQALEKAVKLCKELGHELVEAHPEFDRRGLRRAYFILVGSAVAVEVREAAKMTGQKPDPELFEPLTWVARQLGEVTTAGEAGQWLRFVHRETRRVCRFFEDCDLLLTPTMAAPPPRIGAYKMNPVERLFARTMRTLPTRTLANVFLDRLTEYDPQLDAVSNTMLFNMTGQPAMSIPHHVSSAGLPIGTQYVAKFGDEATLFRLAAQLEQAEPWAERLPSCA
jgi:amidase